MPKIGLLAMGLLNTPDQFPRFHTIVVIKFCPTEGVSRSGRRYD